ncbi:MAG: carboxypeptidase-like regulatory domain-containing protein [Cytophagales bacterium]|nr:carboxypeptidase-like regulatory domain-containing protein [Cytophagales bacterium]
MNKLKYIALFLLFTANFHVSWGQGEKKMIQFSGLVVEGDSLLGIPGAHVFIPKAGRGASTNLLGYFSIPALPGDSLLILAIGYKKQYYIIPEDTLQDMTVMVHMLRDTLMLPEVTIRALPSERAFKQAFLALNLPDEKQRNYMQENLNDQIMRRLLSESTMSASMNHRYYMQQQIQAMEQKYMVQTNPLLDPFAWARFFKDIEAERKKREARKKKQKNDSGY